MTCFQLHVLCELIGSMNAFGGLEGVWEEKGVIMIYSEEINNITKNLWG
jgi:hypothetical protein